MAYNVKVSISGFYLFCKKNHEDNASDFSQFIMNGEGKKSLRIIITFKID